MLPRFALQIALRRPGAAGRESGRPRCTRGRGSPDQYRESGKYGDDSGQRSRGLPAQSARYVRPLSLFTATTRFRRVSRAFHTSPIPPAPIGAITCRGRAVARQPRASMSQILALLNAADRDYGDVIHKRCLAERGDCLNDVSHQIVCRCTPCESVTFAQHPHQTIFAEFIAGSELVASSSRRPNKAVRYRPQSRLTSSSRQLRSLKRP